MLMLSIIIPVYNTSIEKLKRCLESIKYVPEISTEIIVIDDGSEKDIGKFLKTYAQKKENFQYIYQENAGAASARNKGMEIAKGTYLMFVDSDDTVVPFGLEPEDFFKDADIVFFDGISYEHGKKYAWKTFDVSSVKLTRKDILYAAITGRIFSPCKKLFRNAFLKENGLCFNKEMVVSGEDAEFILKAVLCTEKMSYIERNVYCYWHTFNGINDRMYRHSELIIGKGHSFFELKKKILRQNTEFDNKEKEYILNYLISERINGLYNTWSSLFILGKLDERLMKMFSDEVSQIKISMKELTSQKVKAKYYLFKYHHWNVMKFLAVIRNVYLKHRTR